MEGEVEGEVKVRVRFGVVGGGFAYRADLLAWSSRPIRTRPKLDATPLTRRAESREAKLFLNPATVPVPQQSSAAIHLLSTKRFSPGQDSS